MKLHFTATAEAAEALAALRQRHEDAGAAQADVIVALGGDGFMLQTLHAFLKTGKPIYGMNLGSVGFLMNEYHEDALLDRLRVAEQAVVHPLRMTAHTRDKPVEALAFNEVSLLRETRQAAKIRIMVDDRPRIAELICDGVLVSTPAGSTAYNLSAHGPILPIDAALLALTPISAFRPRRWRGALLPNYARIRIDVIDAEHRPVAAVADHTEFRRVCTVETWLDHATTLVLLHDPGHSLEERILREQFG